MTTTKVDLKAPFSIATTPRCRGEEGAIPFSGLLHFTLDAHLIMVNVKQRHIKYNFWVFGMTWPRIELRSPRPLVNTLRTSSMVRNKLSSSTVKGNSMPTLSKFEFFKRLLHLCLWIWLVKIIQSNLWNLSSASLQIFRRLFFFFSWLSSFRMSSLHSALNPIVWKL